MTKKPTQLHSYSQTVAANKKRARIKRGLIALIVILIFGFSTMVLLAPQTVQTHNSVASWFLNQGEKALDWLTGNRGTSAEQEAAYREKNPYKPDPDGCVGYSLETNSKYQYYQCKPPVILTVTEGAPPASTNSSGGYDLKVQEPSATPARGSSGPPTRPTSTNSGSTAKTSSATEKSSTPSKRQICPKTGGVMAMLQTVYTQVSFRIRN